MSLFRSPQVPQQPPQYFTPGQPLGIPAPRVDAQMVQFEAYYRQRVEIQQPQVFRTAAAPITYVAPPALQVPVTQRWPLEWIVENYSAEFTPGLPLGTPLPRQTDQTQATWRCRAEIQQPQIFAASSAPITFVAAPDFFGFEATAEQPPQQPPIYAVQSAPQVFVPSLPLQSLPSTRWALEWIVENYAVEATPGQPLGIPQPRQTDQTQAMWRQRIEIPQPAYFAPIPAPSFYAPRTDYQMAALFPPHPITVEYLDQQLITEFTQGTPLGISQPRQAEQTAAYWRQRVEAIQPVTNQAYPPPAVAFVPPVALQMPFAAQRNEWSILLQQRITAGIALGVPRPRQSDQTAAYYRQHIEILQPIYFALIPPIPISLRRDEFIAGRDHIRYTVGRDNVEFSVPREQVKFKPT